MLWLLVQGTQLQISLVSGKSNINALCILRNIATPHFRLVTVAATPVIVSAGMVSSDNIMVSWTAPSPAPDGYEVFYQTAVDGGAVSGGNTSNTSTELTLTGLSTDEEYTIFVVAFGDTNTIPSPRSNTVTVPAGE